MTANSSRVYYLQYIGHKTEMLDAFDDYLNNQSMVDVMLSCEGKTIKAHKIVLSAGSVYFRNLFGAFQNPLQFPVLIIKDMPFDDLKAIVDFLYKGEVIIPMERVQSLSESAKTLLIRGLEKHLSTPEKQNGTNRSANHSANQSDNHSANHSANLWANQWVNHSANHLTNHLSNNSMTETPKRKTVSNCKGNGRRTQTDANKSVEIPKIKSNVKIPSFTRMRLRSEQRSDYMRLNGDHNSNEDIVVSEVGVKHLSSMESRKEKKIESDRSLTYLKLKSRQIKKELNDNNTRNDVNSEDDNTINGSQLESGVDVHEVATTSRQKYQRVGVKQRSSATKSTPIKADPDNVKLIQCHKCPKKFSFSTAFNIHMRRIHEENKQHICKECNKPYISSSGLYKHRKTKHNTDEVMTPTIH